MIFNAILGWNNTATYGSIISYCLYWIAVALALVYMWFRDRKAAILKAERGETDEDADLALEQAKQYVDQEAGGFVRADDIEKNHNDIQEEIQVESGKDVATTKA